MIRHHTASKIISQLHDLPSHFHSSIQLFRHVVTATGTKTERGHAKVQVIQQATKVSDSGLEESPGENLSLGIELDCFHTQPGGDLHQIDGEGAPAPSSQESQQQHRPHDKTFATTTDV